LNIHYTDKLLAEQVHSRLLLKLAYVVTEQDAMMDFFNNQINMAGMSTGDTEAIISCQVNLDKNFAFLEVSFPFSFHQHNTL